MSDEKIIIRYLDGEMTEDEMLAFEKEISGDPGLADEVEKLRELQNRAGKAMKQKLAEVCSKLGEPGASRRTARLALEMVTEN